MSTDLSFRGRGSGVGCCEAVDLALYTTSKQMRPHGAPRKKKLPQPLPGCARDGMRYQAPHASPHMRLCGVLSLLTLSYKPASRAQTRPSNRSFQSKPAICVRKSEARAEDVLKLSISLSDALGPAPDIAGRVCGLRRD